MKIQYENVFRDVKFVSKLGIFMPELIKEIISHSNIVEWCCNGIFELLGVKQ
jgi:hypothetical protein